MIVKNLKVNNFQLFRSANINFEKISIIVGQNNDSINEIKSGNGSGKSTLVLRAILFGLYGYCEEGLTLKDLIRFGEKETVVEIEIEKDNNLFKIIRKIPSELQIFLNGKEIQANTLTIKQQFITEHFGDVNFFRQYRCVDLKNGINLLDMGIVSVRKTLMGFIEGIFSEIRTKLLAKKVERERYSVDKKLYKHYLSQKRLDILNASVTDTNNQINELRTSVREVQGSISKVNGEISAKKRIIDYKLTETKKAEEGICPILRTQCEKIGKKITEEDKRKMSSEVDKLRQEIKDLEESIVGDNDYLADLEIQMQGIEERKQKTNEKLLRLKGAFQFADYKYTKADIVIYDESVKVLDTFAGEYIKEWLSSLSVIINNLLRPINISVEFSADKDFLKVFDNGQILKYDALSNGQKSFLSVIFKLAILMEQNKTGIILLDDSLNDLDWINFKNLVNILKTLPFQAICVYQGLKEPIEDTKQFTTVREKGESKIA
jgi:predicted  nucleic acid-binding Zn-ribbon protein